MRKIEGDIIENDSNKIVRFDVIGEKQEITRDDLSLEPVQLSEKDFPIISNEGYIIYIKSDGVLIF